MWCRSAARSVRRFSCQAFTWRAARAVCALWFLVSSTGFSGGLSLLSGQSCARNPGTQCHCSLAKRMSGTCCCGREAQTPAAKSCCSIKQPAPKSTEPTERGCCSTKSKPPRVAASPEKVELSIARCDCGPDSPESVSLTQEPRLLVAVAAISFSEMTASFVPSPADQAESALLLPPVPPPKIVL